MKFSKLVAGPLAALLLAAGLVAAGGASTASATGYVLNHRPLACKRGGDYIGGLQPDYGCGYRGSSGGGASGTPDGGPTWGYDRSRYTDTKDMSAWEVLNDPRLFPTSDAIYDCMPSRNGSNLCTRASSTAPAPGVANSTLAQLKDEARRGSVVSWVEDDSIHCTTTQQCFKTTVVFPKYTAEAMYTYSNSGELNVPQVSWYKNDGKGYGNLGSYIGTAKGFLSGASVADAAMEPANTVSASSAMSPGTVATKGTPVNYSVTVRATSTGSTLVRLRVSSLIDATETTVPSDWQRIGTLDGEYITYLVPHMEAGATVSATLRFIVDGFRTPSVSADVNGQTTNSEVNVIPPAPECVAPHAADGHPVAVAGSGATLLDLHCSVAADSTLDVYVPVGRDIKKLSVSGDTVRFVPSDVDFHGEETIYLMARNEGGIASAPTPITVNVVDEAATVDDEFSSQMESVLVVDAAQGILANDRFPGGSGDGWTAIVVDGEGTDSVQLASDGSFRFEAPRRFTGDMTFQYRLVDPRGHSGAFGTATIHVTE